MSLRFEAEHRNAQIAKSLNAPDYAIQPLEFDLTVARDENNPMIVNVPFKSIFIEDASDSTAFIYFRPNTQAMYQGALKFTRRDSWTVDDQLAKGIFHWPAQPGKKMKVILFTNSEFRSGSQVMLMSGGVAIGEGSQIENVKVNVPSAVATILVAQDPDRKKMMFRNKTGVSVFVGPSIVSNVGASEGFEVLPGEIYTHRASCELYVYQASGAAKDFVLEVLK